ncbi:MAG TPA: peptidylprolyl isomerase [Phycisphaerae bacterium]|nr:peptidylprolyl isomerase [Phycisphaerae bacterium]
MIAQRKKRVLMGVGLAVSFAAGAALVRGQTSQPAGAAATAPAPDFSKPIAVINGREINNEAYYGLLLQVSGYRVYEEVRDYILIQQACAQAGFQTSGPDFEKRVQAEYDRALENLSKQTSIPMSERSQLVAILNQTLAKNNIIQPEFRLGLERAAGLRMLAEGKVAPPTQDEMEQAFTAQYGDRVKVDVMSVADISQAAEVRQQVTAGKKPMEIAQERGIPMQEMTIAKNADQIAEIRDEAFKLKPGELSNSIPKNGRYLLVYLEQKIPGQPGAKLTDPAVQTAVKQFIMDVKEQNWMNNQLNNLRSMANIKINDPVLSEIVKANYEALQRAQQAAATQGGATQPAGAPALPGVPAGAPSPSIPLRGAAPGR